MVQLIERVLLRVAPPLTGVSVLITLWAVFFWVPTDAGLGLSQRIFYYHVPCATTSFMAFALAGVTSALFLKTGRVDWDHAAKASVSVGIVFATLVLCTGSVWARTAWGTWS